MGLWSELRSRRLVQFLLGYLVAASAAMGGVDQLVDRSLLPEVAYRLALVAFAAGFLAAWIVAWFHGERGAQRVGALELVLLSVTAAGGVAGGAVVLRNHAGGDPAEALPDLRNIAVLYFEGTDHDQALQPAADGLTETLIDRLRGAGGLNVVTARGVLPFRGGTPVPGTVAERLGAGLLVRGSIQRDEGGSGLRVDAELVDTRSGVILERWVSSVPGENVLDLQEAVATELARNLRSVLGREIRLREERSATRSLTAWLLLQRGRAAVKRGDEEVHAAGPEAAVAAFAAADALFAEAQNEDPAWLRPPVERALLAYHRSRITHDRHEVDEATRAAIAHADEALERAPNLAEAMAVRGTARYWRWLNQLEGPEPSAVLWALARTDLEKAAEIDPDQAMAHSTLSHLYYQEKDVSRAALAAQDALRADAWLTDADNVLWRLFWSHYDLEQHDPADRRCGEGRARFPDDPRFALCQLLVMTMAPAEADVDHAWTLVADVDRLLPPGPRAERHYARLLVGGILGRAGVPDSAAAVLRRARPPAELDPSQELMGVEAFMWTLVGDRDQAIELLQRYVVAAHRFSEGVGISWWWRDLRDHEDFATLFERPAATGG